MQGWQGVCVCLLPQEAAAERLPLDADQVAGVEQMLGVGVGGRVPTLRRLDIGHQYFSLHSKGLGKQHNITKVDDDIEEG